MDKSLEIGQCMPGPVYVCVCVYVYVCGSVMIGRNLLILFRTEIEL